MTLELSPGPSSTIGATAGGICCCVVAVTTFAERGKVDVSSAAEVESGLDEADTTAEPTTGPEATCDDAPKTCEDVAMTPVTAGSNVEAAWGGADMTTVCGT